MHGFIKLSFFAVLMFLNKFRAVRLSDDQYKKLHADRRKKTSEHQCSECHDVLKTVGIHSATNHVENLPDRELFLRCFQDKNSNFYIDEFLRRYNFIIDRKAVKTLNEFGIACTINVAEELYSELVNKFLFSNFFKKAAEHNNPQALISATVRNVVLSWMSKRNRKKNVCNIALENSQVSLDDWVSQGDNTLRLGEIILDQKTDPLNDEYSRHCQWDVDDLTEALSTLSDTERLVFKVKMMFLTPLSRQDIHEIAALRKISPLIIRRNVTQIMKQLDERCNMIKHKQSLLFNQEVITATQLYQLSVLESNPDTPERKLSALREKITYRAKRLENARQRIGKGVIQPSAKQVAILLGIPKNNVGVRFCNAKKKMTIFFQKVNANEDVPEFEKTR